MRQQIETISCDFCGYGGAYTRPQDFQRFDGVDLCSWCARSDVPVWMETGRHLVTFTDLGWWCSCGGTMPTATDIGLRLGYGVARVLRAVPSIRLATAHVHMEER
jgi:hypothetical protein